jgi:hypothetical protein
LESHKVKISSKYKNIAEVLPGASYLITMMAKIKSGTEAPPFA